MGDHPRQSKTRYIGAGVEWVRPIERQIAAQLSEIDCVELTPENFFGGRSPAFIKALAQSQIPVIIHGIELSLGSFEPIKAAHLDQMRAIADQVNTVYFSEHLSYSEARGIEIGELTPLPFTQVSCDNVCRKIETLMQQLPYPFMIENVANRFLIPGAEMTEAEFINQVLRRTGCGFQFDITNLYTNSVNFGFDVWEWFDAVDLNSVEGVQLAGGTYDVDGALLDNHSAVVPDPVWKLFERLLEKGVVPTNTIVEWTDNFPPYATVLGEVRKARERLEARRNGVWGESHERAAELISKGTSGGITSGSPGATDSVS